MVSKKKLKLAAKEKGFCLKDLANVLGIAYGSFLERLGRGVLRSNEIEALIAILGLSPKEYEAIFFDKLTEARKLM